MKIAFFTTGHIGRGHLTRAHAIYAGLERTGIDFEWAVFRVDPRKPYAGVGLFRSRFQAFRPDLVLVDIDLPLYAKLVGDTKAAVWLLMRLMPDETLKTMHRLYGNLPEKVFTIEPGFDWPGLTWKINPIVAYNPSDMKSRADAREFLEITNDDVPLTIRIHSDESEMGVLPTFPPRSNRVIQRRLDWHDMPAACTLLNAADFIISAAGYNRFWETHWLGLTEKTHFTPLCGARWYDDQGDRMRWHDAIPGYKMDRNGADQLALIIANQFHFR